MWGPQDRQSVQAREDILVYTSEPLPEDTEVTGPVELRLYIASTAPDTDFTAPLTDVHPDGRAVHVCEGIRGATFRESLEQPTPIEPEYRHRQGGIIGYGRRRDRDRAQVPHAPHPGDVAALIVLVLLLSWLVPSGSYERAERDGRQVTVPGTYQQVDKAYLGPQWLLIAPIRGFLDGALIIAFLLMMGGVFGIVQATGTIEFALKLPCAFITECADYPTSRLRTLAFWSDGRFCDNFEYDLPGTPCEEVVNGAKTCFHPTNVGTRFPREAGYEGYVGVPIVGSDGRVMGHLAFLDRKPMSEEVLVDSIYRIFTARAAAELERKRLQSRMLGLVQALDSLHGEICFQALAKAFAEIMEVREAIVTECVGEPYQRLHVLAWWRDGRLEPQMEYDLKGLRRE